MADTDSKSSSDNKDAAKKSSGGCPFNCDLRIWSWPAEAWAFLCLRLWLGFRFLTAGLEKFAGDKLVDKLDEAGNPMVDDFGDPIVDPVFGFRVEHYENYKETFTSEFTGGIRGFPDNPLMPEWAVGPFVNYLGYALIVLAVLLLVGLKTRYMLALMGFMFVSLSYGAMLQGNQVLIMGLGIHMALVALALMLSRHEKLVIWKS